MSRLMNCDARADGGEGVRRLPGGDEATSGGQEPRRRDRRF